MTYVAFARLNRNVPSFHGKRAGWARDAWRGPPGAWPCEFRGRPEAVRASKMRSSACIEASKLSSNGIRSPWIHGSSMSSDGISASPFHPSGPSLPKALAAALLLDT